MVSVPHCGTAFPDELKDQYHAAWWEAPDDTDWFVDQLYGFAPAMGMTLISATYSRWVIDLNRDPQSKPLYTDGRIITGLCPTTDFLGNALYIDRRTTVSADETNRRLDAYYWPYHHQLQTLLEEKKKKFGTVLLWDCHSIRQHVPTIQPDKFPDLILGSADETSADKALIACVLDGLRASGLQLTHNHPFKGGYITRQYGQPSRHQHALQLEMSKVNYMDDAEREYDTTRAARIQQVLKSTFEKLTDVLVR